MANNRLNLFDECAAECVHMCPQEEECTSSLSGDSKIYTPGITANSRRTSTKINKNGAIANVRILVEQVILKGI